MAAVHGKDRFTRHHVDRIRLRVDFTESKHQRVAVGFRFGDGFAADAAESMDGVAAVAHWGGAGMVRFAVEGNGVAALTDDGVDHADGLLVGFQHAALFDMQFNEGFNIPARRQRGGGQATGEFSQNQYQGKGSLYFEDETLEYEGGFAAGKYSGSGSLYDKDGTLIYEGSFETGRYSGEGTLYGEKGMILYEGSFVKGLYEGQGTLYRNGKKVYVGAFAGGIPQGEGKAYGNSGRADSWGTYADGEFVAGQTVLYDENGKIQYRGEVSNGQYEGKGSLYADGENNRILAASSGR